jgi:hypothetical protein
MNKPPLCLDGGLFVLRNQMDSDTQYNGHHLKQNPELYTKRSKYYRPGGL